MNRIEELNKLPKSKEAINKLINCIASNRYVVDDEILVKTIEKLTSDIREDCKEE